MNENELMAQSIRQLQMMLNALAIHNPALPRLAADGIFGERTLEAVMIFQRDFFPPVNGVVNNAVWDAITAAYVKDQLENGSASPLRVLPGGWSTTEEGESGEQVLLTQAMLSSLSRRLTNFDGREMDRANTGGTLADLRAVQRLAGLPVSGTLDRATWEYLTRLYHIFVTRVEQL